MAQTVSGFYGLVDAVGEAGRFHRLAPPRVDRAGLFPATPSATRVITIGAGSLLCCGIRFTENASAAVTLPANSSGAVRYDVVGYRFTWTANGGTVVLFSKQGTSTALPVLDRRPGIVYEMPLVLVTVRSGVTTVSSADIADMRVVGGFGGGAFTINNTTGVNGLDLPQGSYLRVGAALYQAWTVNGQGQTSMLLIATSTGPWQPFTPTLRDGFGSACGLGSLGSAVGRYKIVDGYCHIKVSISAAGSGVSMGVGQLSIDLPVATAGFDDHPFGDGRMYTVVGDGSYNWPVKISFRANYGLRGKLFSVGGGNDARIAPLQAFIQGSSPGRGYPYIGPAGTLTLPSTLNIDAEYLIAK